MPHWTSHFKRVCSERMQIFVPAKNLKSFSLPDSEPVWPDAGLKNCPNISKSCLNNIHSVLYINWSFSKQPKSQQSFWIVFIGKYVAKNFQKSSNLVTLFGTHFGKKKIMFMIELKAKSYLMSNLNWRGFIDLWVDFIKVFWRKSRFLQNLKIGKKLCYFKHKYTRKLLKWLIHIFSAKG